MANPVSLSVTDDLGLSSTDRITSDNTVVLSGIADAAVTVEITVTQVVGNTVIALQQPVSTDAGGFWTFDLDAFLSNVPLADGEYSVDVFDTGDGEFNIFAFTVDTTAPAGTPTLATTITTDTGVSATDLVTSDTTVTVTGTSAAADGERVAVLVGGVTDGFATVTAGAWSYTTTALAEGAASITAAEVDAAGNLGTPSAALVVTVDTTAPAGTPSLATTITTDTGVSATDLVTSDTTVTVTGTSAAADGERVAVLVGGITDGFATVTAGAWSYTTTALAEGAASITAAEVDAAGNLGTPSAALVVTVDTTAPAGTPTLATTITTDTGVSATDLVTSDTTVTVTGTSAAADGERVAVLVGGVTDGFATVTAGTWSYTTTALAEGAASITAAEVDAAGNLGTQSAALVVTVDTTAPAGTPSLASTISLDSGVSATDLVTSDTTVTVTGTSAAADGERVAVLVGGVTDGFATVTAGAWSYTTTALTEGAASITAAEVDAAGNLGTQSAALVVTVDTTAPAGTPSLATTVMTDTGVSATDLVTSDTTVTVTGTSAAADGERVAVLVGGVTDGFATVTAGAWSYTTTALAEGAASITAAEVDTAGNLGTQSAALVVTVDTTAPAGTPTLASTISLDSGVSASDLVTSDTTVTVTGTSGAADGEQVAVLVGGVTDGFATVTAGAWSYTTTALAEGAASITAAEVDAAGNLGTQSAALVVTVDTTAPAGTPTLASTISLDSGVSASDLVTSDTTVTVTGTSGAADGEQVAVLVGGVTDGFATVTAGAWSYTTTALAEGAASITAAEVDAAGNLGTQSAALVVTVDTTAPAGTPTLASTISLDSGVSASDLVTSDTTVTVTGTSAAADGEQVAVLVGGVTDGFATVTAGAWSYTTTALAEGAASITAAKVDAAGNLGTQSAALVVTVDTTAPAGTPTLASTISLDSGVSATDLVTSDTTVTVTGTSAAADGERVAVLVGGVTDGFATVTAGAWSYTTTALAEGAASITAAEVDAAGNLGTQSAALVVTVDTTAPAGTPSLATTITTDTGVSATDLVTSDTTVTVTGTSAAADGERVAVLVGGVTDGFATVTAGAWSYTTTALAEGAASITAAEVDAAGNLGTQSAALVVTVDTTAPAGTPSLATTITTDTGVSATDLVTSDTTVTVTGTTVANGQVELFVGGVSNGFATADDAGDWSYTTTALADGAQAITVADVDGEGTAGTQSAALVVTIDTTAPAGTPTLDTTTIGLDTGVSATDLVTSDNTVTVIGTTVANGRVQLFVDGVANGFATADDAGDWSYTTTALAEGDASITAAEVDAAGNAGPQSDALVVTIDTTAPVTLPTLATTISLDTGANASDRVTNDNTPTVGGTTTANGRVQVFVSGLANGFATADAAGTWSYTTTALADGVAAITAAEVDVAGNVGLLGSALNITVDTVAPANVPSIYEFSQVAVAGGFSVTVLGNAEAGSTVSVRDGGSAVGAVTAGGDGNWSLTVTLGGASHAFTATATDLAGNVSAVGGMAAPLARLAPSPDASNDVNADGRDDILWQNADGQLAVWTMAAGFRAGGGLVGPNPGPSWQARDFGDFDGDGKADVLWQDANGSVAIWTLNGAAATSGAVLAVAPSADWVVRGAGDFNGDGKDDILWQNASGAVVIWQMNGFQIAGGGALAFNPGPAWTAKFAADFNGDGKSDILWQNADGAVAVWTMNGTSLTAGAVLPTNPGTAWAVKAAGDVNGDGKADVILQRTDGAVAIWTMDGTNVTGGGVLGVNPGAEWQIEASADYNGDGADDILFQNANGAVSIWAMTGMRVIGGDLLPINPGPSWDII